MLLTFCKKRMHTHICFWGNHLTLLLCYCWLLVTGFANIEQTYAQAHRSVTEPDVQVEILVIT